MVIITHSTYHIWRSRVSLGTSYKEPCLKSSSFLIEPKIIYQHFKKKNEVNKK